MPSKIYVLSDSTINKIAAGEVIENPASVVKELVENAIDAGAKEICVEIKGGGRQLIRVTDDGCGMNADDALLCLERHATSKIRQVEDIHEVSTMGFRGEAIPSIASISKFTLHTCPADATDPNQQNMGTLVIVDGGQVIKCGPAARSSGTTVEVKSLFFNVPVRKQFQKSPTYDANEIQKILGIMALGHPHIKFQLISNQEIQLLTQPASAEVFNDNLSQRIKTVLGDEFYRALIPLSGQKDQYKIRGFIGLPYFTRPNRTGQYLFINQRAVFSPLVNMSVKDGYGTTLPANRHPIFVLHLSIPGGLVDVNVHPQKREVRLRQDHLLKEIIVQAVENALQKANVPLMTYVAPYTPSHLDIPVKLEEHVPTYFERKKAPELNIERTSFTRPPAPTKTVPSSAPSPMTKTPMQDEPVLFAPRHETRRPTPKVLAAIPGYIIVDSLEVREGLSIVDQRAAHFRIIFERLMQQKEKQTGNGSFSQQNLLIPYVWETSLVETGILRANLELLNGMGIRIHESGPNHFLIDAVPEIFGNIDIQALVTDIVHSVMDQDPASLNREIEKRMAFSASRTAVSSGKRFSVEEAQHLLAQLMQCHTPYLCPSGKSIFAHLTYDDLSKLFQKS